MSDTIKSITPLDTTHEISKLIQYSPNRANHFKSIQVNIMLELWDEILDERIDSDVRACVGGVCSQMITFDSLECDSFILFYGTLTISVKLCN